MLLLTASRLSESPEEITTSIAGTFIEAPHIPIRHLQTLWNKNKATVLDDDSELAYLLNALSFCFSHELKDNIEYRETDFTSTPGHPKRKLWDACLKSDLLITLLEMVTDECFARQSSRWIESVLALNAVFSRIWIASDHPKATYELPDRWTAPPERLVKDYLQRQPSVWDVLWNKRDILFSESSSPASNKILPLLVFACSVSSLYTELYPEYKRDFISIPLIVGVSLAGWTHIAAAGDPSIELNPTQHILAFQTVLLYRHSFPQPSGNIDRSPVARSYVKLWRNNVDPLIEAIGPQKFIRACCTALLSWPCMVGSNLMFFLEGLQHIVAIRKSYGEATSEDNLAVGVRRAFWDSPMLQAVAQALEREAKTAPAPLSLLQMSRFRLGISFGSFWLVDVTLDGIVCRLGNPAVCDGQSMYKVLSHSLRMLCGNVCDKDSDRAKEQYAVEMFKGICSGCAEMCAAASLPSEVQTRSLYRIQQGVATAARTAWYADLHDLRSFREQLVGDRNYLVLVQAWLEFGRSLGLEETVLRDQHSARNRHMCSWFGCDFHMKASPKPLSTCVGCGEQKYCSRDCQRKDWKQGGHRTKCRRLNA